MSKSQRYVYSLLSLALTIKQTRVPKQKGIDGLIEVENPNRAAKKSIKAKDIDVDAKVELSRRERYAVVGNKWCVIFCC